LAKVVEISLVRQTQGSLILRIEQHHFVVYSFSVEIQFDLKPRILGFPSLRVVEGSKSNDAAFTSVVFDEKYHCFSRSPSRSIWVLLTGILYIALICSLPSLYLAWRQEIKTAKESVTRREWGASGMGLEAETGVR
jgi:hypothetical protein